MTWASILAVTDGAAGSDAAMAAAIDLGQRFGARVTFLHVANDSSDLLPYVGEGMSATALEQVMASVEAGNARRREAVEASFKRLCAGLPQVLPEESVPAGSFAVSRNIVPGRPPEVIAQLGPPRDLFLMPPPARPASEGALAATAALPLLGKASEVVVITAREDDDVIEPSALARYLQGHGIEAKTWAYTPAGESITEGLLGQAERVGADCLVMGAYGHSRLRERILGGATEGVLQKSRFPVLMMH